MFVNYDESILSVVASIRKYYGLSSAYQDDSMISDIINQKQPSQIILCLIDGMGSRLLQRKLGKTSFLNQHMVKEVSTVFPPTTTAATTAILNGKSPNQNAWLGWSQYFKNEDDIIIPFLKKGYYNEKDYDDTFLKDIETTNIIDELNSTGIKADEVPPHFKPNGYKDVEDFFDKVKAISYTDNRFVYAYLSEYDSLMHKEGVDVGISDDLLNEINERFLKLNQEIKTGTMLIIIADHGLVDIKEEINLYDTEFKEMFKRPPYNEPRSLMMDIKKEFIDDFKTKFLNYYEDDFILLSRQEMLETHLFGDKDNHPKLNQFLGDFIAISKGNKHFIYSDKEDRMHFKGSHAGCHKDELMVPVIIYQR